MYCIVHTVTVVAYASSNDSLSLRYFSQHHPLTVPCDQEEARSLRKFNWCHWFRGIDTIMYSGYRPFFLSHNL